jgi:hypothetical protein
MSDALIGIPVVAIVALVLGAGWSAVLYRAAPWGFLGFIFRAWISAIALTSIVWAWAYPLGFDVRWGIGFQLGVAVVGYIVAIRLRSFRRVRAEATLRVLFELIVPFVLVVVALIPAMSSLTRLTVAERIGPDAFGYAISARAIDLGLTHHEIDAEILRESGGTSVATVISPVTKGIDTTPSFTTQVDGEFLEGADRWGFAGAVGSTLFVIGAGHLWSLLSLFAGFALLTTIVGIWALVRWRGYSPWCAAFVALLIALSPSLLNAWHEGGLGQVWVMPATLILVSPIVRPSESDRLGMALAAGLGVATIIPSYNDDVLTFGLILAASAVLSIPIVKRRWWAKWSAIAGGIIAGSVLVLPATTSFLGTLRTRLSENGTAGWPQPHWASLGEAFGMSNAYGVNLPGYFVRTFDNRIFDGLGTVVVLIFLMALCRRRTSQPAFVLLTSTLLVGIAIYVDTRYISKVSNYQYFKSIATLVPVGALAMGLLLGAPRSTSFGDSAMLRLRSRVKAADRLVLGTVVVMVVAICVAGASYFNDYRTLGATMPASFEGLSSSASAQAAFNRYNVLGEAVGPPTNPLEVTLDTYAMAAEANLRFIGRSYGAPSTRLGDRITSPVAIAVFEWQCPSWNCLSKIAPDKVVLRQFGVALVELDSNTEALSKLPETQWPAWIVAKYRALGGTLPGLLPAGPPR